MSYEFSMRDDGILVAKVVGEFTEEMADGYLEGLFSYLEGMSDDSRLHSLLDSTELKRVSPGVRRAVADQIQDNRFGKTAVWGNNRFVKVLIDFLVKATGRDNIRYFTEQDEAITWLHESG